MNEAQILIALVRQEICGGTADPSLGDHITRENLQPLLKLSAQHDLQHIVCHALLRLEKFSRSPAREKLSYVTQEAVFRYARMAHDFEQACAVLTEAGIPHIPLKGSVLRNWYPEPWMRTSCDIDLLVKESDLEAAAQALEQRLRFTRGGKGHHDISMVTPKNIHFELHFTVENFSDTNREQDVLADFWKAAAPEADSPYRLAVSDEMFYFYHITHMAKHLQDAECGIRPFLDLWVMNHRIPANRKAREALLKKGHMLRFAQKAEALAEVWFSGGEPDPLSARLEAFILQRNTEDYEANFVALQQKQQGGRLKFLLRRIFPPFARMCWYYPVLREKPWLLPFCAVRRWCRLIFTKDARRALNTVKVTATVSDENIHSVAGLMEQLDLNR